MCISNYFEVQTFFFIIRTQIICLLTNTEQGMIQIRQKKEQLRKEIRREFLDNYFREMRRSYFKFEGTRGKGIKEMGVLEMLLEESLKVNGMVQRMRTEGMVQEIEGLVGEAVKKGNLFEVRILLTIISNALKDQLTAQQKTILYKLSSNLFQTLNLSNYDKQVQPQPQFFHKTLQTLHPQTLTFYISTITQTSPYLDQPDQIHIQHLMYPAFANILIFSLEHPQELTSIQQFQGDVARFFKNIFDQKEEFYEQGNRMKAQRLMGFYEELMMGHLWVLENCQGWQTGFKKMQIVLMKAYAKFVEVLGQVPEFMRRRELFAIMEFGLRKCSRKQIDSQLNFIYLLLGIFIDHKLMLYDVENLLLIKDIETNVMAFERAINLVIENSQSRYRALEMVEAVVVSMFEQNNFREIVQQYEIKLIDMCAQVLSRFQKQMIGRSKQRKTISRALTIIRVLAEKQKIQGKKDKVSLVGRFESQSGKRALQCVSEWFSEVDVGEDQDIGNAIEYMEEILQVIELDMEIEVEG